jgi:NitT/TauT family transport system ATP-binding protein
LLIASMGLSGLEDRRPHELAPGMAQRVAICRALVHCPELFLADDPFQFMDPLTREQISMDLQRLWAREPITVLYATSQIEEAVQLSHRVAVMSPDGSGIVETICIDLPYPRRMDKATTPRIVEYSNRIRTIFHALGVFP